ncbi:MAG TPA: heme-binding protein [Vineibacter sp.]|nr:heme-binding protein [Vineibacter sp.]
MIRRKVTQAAAVAFAVAALASLPIASSVAQAPAPPPAYGLGISLEAAKKALAAAEAEARKNNWPVAIAVVDSSAKLVAFSKLDNTQHGSVEIAIGKAVTAVNLRRPTKALQDAIGQGGANLRLLAVPGVTPLEGGTLILGADGKIIGGIGVSGVTSQQDAQVADAGVAAAK